jgi:hypothetical protein
VTAVWRLRERPSTSIVPGDNRGIFIGLCTRTREVGIKKNWNSSDRSDGHGGSDRSKRQPTLWCSQPQHSLRSCGVRGILGIFPRRSLRRNLPWILLILPCSRKPSRILPVFPRPHRQREGIFPVLPPPKRTLGDSRLRSNSSDSNAVCFWI